MTFSAPVSCPRAWITIGTLSIATVALLCPASALGEPQDGDETAAIRRHWDRARSEVQSAEITYRHVLRQAQAGISRERVQELLGNADLVGNDAAITKLARGLDPTIPVNEPPWVESKFLFADGQTRADSSYSGREKTHVRTEANEIYSRTVSPQGGKQTDIYSAGRSQLRLASLSDFRFVPAPTLAESLRMVTRSERTATDIRLTLKSGSREVVADADTGFVHEYRLDKVAENQVDELLQFGRIKTPAGSEFPAVKFSANYRDGTLYRFSLWIIDAARLNNRIEKERFLVQGKAGDVVVDFRQDPPDVVASSKDWPDVLQSIVEN